MAAAAVSTSNSTDFNLVTNQLVDEAFDICGIGSEGEAITADQYARARRSLNLIVKHRGAKGHLWTRTERSVTLVASTGSYALTPKPLRVIEARRRVTASNIDAPLMELTREQYFAQGSKSVDAVPTAFYYDPQIVAGTLYLWPRPTAATAAAQTLRLTYLRRIEDFDGSGDDADMPQEALLSLSYDLAEQLALKYGVRRDLRDEIAARAKLYRDEIEAWDTEPGSLFLQPDYWE